MAPLYQHFNKQKVVIPNGLKVSNWTQINNSLANNTMTYDSSIGALVMNSNTYGSNPNTNTYWDYNLWSSTAPKTLIMKCMYNVEPSGLVAVGPYFKNSSSGKFTTFGMRKYTGHDFQLINRSSNTSESSVGVVSTSWTTGQMYWLKCADDGTNFTYSLSSDGVSYAQQFTQTLSSFLGSADKVGFYFAPAYASISDFRIYDFTVT